MKRITKADKREFIRRCKVLARRDGKRIKYHPARWTHEISDGLTIRWQADEDVLHVRVKLPDRKIVNERWSLVVESCRFQAKWGYVHKVHHHLNLMRGLMVLDDLADV